MHHIQNVHLRSNCVYLPLVSYVSPAETTVDRELVGEYVGNQLMLHSTGTEPRNQLDSTTSCRCLVINTPLHNVYSILYYRDITKSIDRCTLALTGGSYVVMTRLLGIGYRKYRMFSGIGRSESDFRSIKRFFIINITIIESMV